MPLADVPKTYKVCCKSGVMPGRMQSVLDIFSCMLSVPLRRETSCVAVYRDGNGLNVRLELNYTGTANQETDFFCHHVVHNVK